MEMLRQELTDRTTIHFSRILGTKKLRDFFRYISKDTCCQIIYTAPVRNVVGEIGKKSDRYAKHIEDIIGSMKFPEVVSIKFSLLREGIEKWHPGFNALQFSTRAGYKIYQVNPKELELMDCVRESIGRYFSQVSKD